MTGSNTAAVGAVGAVAAAVAGGPLSEVFNELSLLLVVMGAAGGATKSLAIKVTWREAIRGIVLGGLIAFGLGSTAPSILSTVLGVSLDGDASSARYLAAIAYLVGYMQDVLISWSTKGSSDGK